MKHAQLADMVNGWFIGDFDPVVVRTADVEVAVKHYRAGDKEDLHHHRVATEVTVIASGIVRMLDRIWEAGAIVVIEPGEATAFEAISDAVTLVVKLPGAKNDKFMGCVANSGDN